MSYTERFYGTAERRSMMEIPKSSLPLPEEPTSGDPSDYADFDARRFANLVYIVGSGGGSGGGGVSTTVTNTVAVSGTVTSDPKLYTQVIVDDTSGTIYIAEALPGTSKPTAAWRAKRVVQTTIGSSSVTYIDWADGNTNFDNVGTATALSGFTYS